MAFEHLRHGTSFNASHFDHLAFAQRLTCHLKLTVEEEAILSMLVETLNAIRRAYRQSRVMAATEPELATILRGICAMESVWVRYPKRHLEACYDREMLALYKETTALIEKAA